MFEKASRAKLRFQVNNGVATTEDLWDLSLARLNVLAKALRREIRASEEDEDFLGSTNVDPTTQLKFDIVLHVLNTKKIENEAAKDAQQQRERRQRAMQLLAERKDQKFNELSDEELEAIAKGQA